jgi:glycosyltransferase involved in cell wall biosynthesis
MRVAIITENFLPKLDGVTRTLARLLEHLQEQGHQALLLGPDSGMDYYAGAEVVGTAGLPLPFYPELKVNLFRPLFMRRLREFQPDIIHLVDPVALGAAGLAAARLLNIPPVSSYHTNLAVYCSHFGFPLLTQPMLSYNRFLHNQCTLTFCPSLSTAAKLRAQGFSHVRLWPRGVDTSLFYPGRRNTSVRHSWLGSDCWQDVSVILYVGRVSWEKNLRLLVQAYRRMDHRHCRLVIVGDGPARVEMEQELAGVPVIYTGYLKGEALAEAYASADIFAFPSTTETFGQVVLEAMASGLPVVGLLSEGVCDLVISERTGYLLDARYMAEAEAIALYQANLSKLVEAQLQRREMGLLALCEARKYSWREAMTCLVQGYQEVIERTKPLVAA